MGHTSKDLPAAGKTRGKQQSGGAFCQKAFQALKAEFKNNLICSCTMKKYHWVVPKVKGELGFRTEHWLAACLGFQHSMETPLSEGTHHALG